MEFNVIVVFEKFDETKQELINKGVQITRVMPQIGVLSVEIENADVLHEVDGVISFEPNRTCSIQELQDTDVYKKAKNDLEDLKRLLAKYFPGWNISVEEKLRDLFG